MLTFSNAARLCRIFDKSRSTIYLWKDQELITTPVKLSTHASGWPDDEIETICEARKAGLPDNEIRIIVRALMAQRKDLRAELSVRFGLKDEEAGLEQ